jgi:hypothetical protein
MRQGGFWRRAVAAIATLRSRVGVSPPLHVHFFLLGALAT